ncbi:PRC-barrel domain containing protein [Paraglaciecola sp.]|uniref:PRC-barrel domain containing protein n=1 Tax=Paraglaciecola sp. TaxID=1920173 RepID=UPI0030F3AD9A
MYAGLRDIKRFTIAATDGDIGVSKDFLFDDRAWTVRYMYADTNKWLPLGEKVLISPVSLRSIDTEDEKIHVALSKQQVKDSPSIDEHKTVSREYEELYFQYFGYGYYWIGPGAWGEYAHPTELADGPKVPENDTLEKISEDAKANHLRSIDELQGYEISARNGNFGQIYDVILDTNNWEIPLIVIDTHQILPGGKKVLIAPKHIDSINWLEKNVSSHLTVEVIKHCPEYEPELLNDSAYQQKVKQQLLAL